LAQFVGEHEVSGVLDAQGAGTRWATSDLKSSRSMNQPARFSGRDGGGAGAALDECHLAEDAAAPNLATLSFSPPAGDGGSAAPSLET
jgi:hypothetical protein